MWKGESKDQNHVLVPHHEVVGYRKRHQFPSPLFPSSPVIVQLSLSNDQQVKCVDTETT